MKVAQSCPTLRVRLYSQWNSPGQNTGVGSLSLLQGIFPTQGSNPGLLYCRQILYQLRHCRRILYQLSYLLFIVCQAFYTYYFWLFQQHCMVCGIICIYNWSTKRLTSLPEATQQVNVKLGFEQMPDSKLWFFQYARLPSSTRRHLGSLKCILQVLAVPRDCCSSPGISFYLMPEQQNSSHLYNLSSQRALGLLLLNKLSVKKPQPSK